MKIWIDGDACPQDVKAAVFKASGRLKIPVEVVANSNMFVPPSPFIHLVRVKKGADVADQHIADNVTPEDLVVTADIPLAAIIVDKGAMAIDPRGEVYTEENVHQRLSMRDFMKDLRDSGLVINGPASFGAKDKQRFINALDRVLTKIIKKIK